MLIYLIIRQYYWRTDAPCANRSGGPNMKKKSAKHYLKVLSSEMDPAEIRLIR